MEQASGQTRPHKPAATPPVRRPAFRRQDEKHDDETHIDHNPPAENDMGGPVGAVVRHRRARRSDLPDMDVLMNADTMTKLRSIAALVLLAATCAQAQEQPTAPTPQAETRWRGVRVTAESARAGYERPDWHVGDTEIHRRDGSPPCTPYTRTPITYVGPGDGLDREHIVALAEAWDSRPRRFDEAAFRAVAEDHANLTLADPTANRRKSARDAAGWRPRYNAAWMAHRVVEVKRRHGLSVDPAERDALEALLASGPDRITCEGATPAAAPRTVPGRTTADHPPVRTYRNCALLRRAGWNRGVRQDGGSYRNGWNDAERRTYALNTGRDGDGDGHACE